jgi:putative tricarboxylic transport membrane protein
MQNRDLLSSMIWMALGAIFLLGSLQLGLMRRGVPGPGFLPFLSGLALIFVSLFVFIPAFRKKKNSGSSDFLAERHSLKKLMLALIALFAFGIAMEYAGYLLTTFLFMFFMGRLMEPRGWPIVILLAILTAVLSHMLFVVLLGVQLPKGLFQF